MPTHASSAGAAPPPGARDVILAGVIALVASAFYRAIALERFANDGPQLASVFVRVPDAVHWQVLYLPFARLLARFVPGGDPFEPLRLVSALGAGVGLGSAFLVARGFGMGSYPAYLAIVIVGAARYVCFFGATVEVHALHFGMVGLAACVTLFGPWRTPALALPLAALALGATWTTHATAVLLGPGWVALVAYARARVAAPFAMRTLLLVVGPSLLAGLLLFMLPLKAWWVATRGGASDLEWGIVAAYFRNADHVAFLRAGLVGPLGLVLPLALAGLWVLWRTSDTIPAARALALLLGPGTAFVVGWGVPEDGGYFLGHAAFHVVLVAALFMRIPRAAAGVAAVALVAQVVLTQRSLQRFDERFDPAERVRLAAETLGAHGYLGKIAYLAPDVTIWLPGVEEVELTGRLRAGFDAGLPPDELARAVAPALAAAMADRSVAVDVSYRTERFDLAGPEFPPYVDEFVDALLAHFDVELCSRGTWTFAVLRPR